MPSSEEGILYKYDEAKNVYYHPLHDKGYIGEFAKGFLDTTQILTM